MDFFFISISQIKIDEILLVLLYYVWLINKQVGMQSTSVAFQSMKQQFLNQFSIIWSTFIAWRPLNEIFAEFAKNEGEKLTKVNWLDFK